MNTKVKICGITTLADARYAAGAGADYIGFIQHTASSRYIEPGRAREIIEWLYGPEPVGVFMDSRAEVVNAVASETGYRLVQLHGSESPEYCRQIALPVIKAFSFRPDETAAELAARMRPYEEVAMFALIDSYVPDGMGGSGVANRFADLQGTSFPLPYFIAGGLTPTSVSSVVDRLSPYGVDVSTGVEVSPGLKDFEKIDAFIGSLRHEEFDQ